MQSRGLFAGRSFNVGSLSAFCRHFIKLCLLIFFENFGFEFGLKEDVVKHLLLLIMLILLLYHNLDLLNCINELGFIKRVYSIRVVDELPVPYLLRCVGFMKLDEITE
jgi:hypothetical protein